MAPTNDTEEHPSNRALERRLERIEGLLERILKLEIEHNASKEAINRAFIEIGKLDARLGPLERDAPVVSLVRNWVLKLVYAIVAAALIAMLALVIPNMPWKPAKAAESQHPIDPQPGG